MIFIVRFIADRVAKINYWCFTLNILKEDPGALVYKLHKGRGGLFFCLFVLLIDAKYLEEYLPLMGT